MLPRRTIAALLSLSLGTVALGCKSSAGSGGGAGTTGAAGTTGSAGTTGVAGTTGTAGGAGASPDAAADGPDLTPMPGVTIIQEDQVGFDAVDGKVLPRQGSTGVTGYTGGGFADG